MYRTGQLAYDNSPSGQTTVICIENDNDGVVVFDPTYCKEEDNLTVDDLLLVDIEDLQLIKEGNKVHAGEFVDQFHPDDALTWIADNRTKLVNSILRVDRQILDSKFELV